MNQWRKLNDVEGNLINLIKQAPAHEPIKINNGHHTFHICKSGSKFEVKIYGSGGGYVNTRTFGASRTRTQIKQTQCRDLEFRRP